MDEIKEVGEPKQLQDEDYNMHCAYCKSADNLSCVPHRIGGAMIGFVFTCNMCWRKIRDGDIRAVKLEMTWDERPQGNGEADREVNSLL